MIALNNKKKEKRLWKINSIQKKNETNCILNAPNTKVFVKVKKKNYVTKVKK